MNEHKHATRGTSEKTERKTHTYTYHDTEEEPNRSPPRQQNRHDQNPRQPSQSTHDRPMSILFEGLTDDDAGCDGCAAEGVERDAGDEGCDGPGEEDEGEGHDDAAFLVGRKEKKGG